MSYFEVPGFGNRKCAEFFWEVVLKAYPMFFKFCFSLRYKVLKFCDESFFSLLLFKCLKKLKESFKDQLKYKEVVRLNLVLYRVSQKMEPTLMAIDLKLYKHINQIFLQMMSGSFRKLTEKSNIFDEKNASYSVISNKKLFSGLRLLAGNLSLRISKNNSLIKKPFMKSSFYMLNKFQ